jgi:glutamate-1-semialdehyde 2,1-aminomutase/spore coat polysaccharide biosynthesis protein SpsF
MKTAAIIQARMNSTRFPGKVLEDLAGQPMLFRVVERARRARTLQEVIVATSDQPSDDRIAERCAANGVTCIRGSENDVLDRFHRVAQATKADVVVRITADCPLLDPAVVDRVVEAFYENVVDYASNVMPCTYPDGLDVEVFSAQALARAWREAKKQSEREHVTPYLRYSGQFRVINVAHKSDLSSHRWTVDDLVDLAFVRRVFERLGPEAPFGIEEILSLLAADPTLRQMQGQAVMNEGYFRSLHAQATSGAAAKRPLRQSHAWLARAERVIPNASQTFSKSRSQYVQGASPIFLERGKGCRVWDVDGNEYIDYVQALLPNILGYAHDDVNEAFAKQLAEGHSFSLPHPLEVQLAERLTQIIPCAEMVRFGKNGSDATAGAVRAARAHTGCERIACCGYHGWQDWYIGSTTRSAGVPGAVRALTHPFPYNDLPALERLLQQHSGQFAAVIMEPVNFVEPQPGYLEGVRSLAHRHGALLIFDEICTGFHLGLGGAQKLFGVTPDLACFGKAMGNGFPISCIVGKRNVMKVFEEIFVSFTFAGEAASMAAALKVLDILQNTEILLRLASFGRVLKDGFNSLAKEAGLAERFVCVGYPQWSLLKFKDAEGKDSLLERSLFQQETCKRGLLLLATHNMTAAHDTAAVHETLEIYAATLKTLAGWLSDPNPARFLEGPMIQPVFRVR